jgi:hypothetical protein
MIEVYKDELCSYYSIDYDLSKGDSPEEKKLIRDFKRMESRLFDLMEKLEPLYKGR